MPQTSLASHASSVVRHDNVRQKQSGALVYFINIPPCSRHLHTSYKKILPCKAGLHQFVLPHVHAELPGLSQEGTAVTYLTQIGQPTLIAHVYCVVLDVLGPWLMVRCIVSMHMPSR